MLRSCVLSFAVAAACDRTTANTPAPSEVVAAEPTPTPSPAQPPLRAIAIAAGGHTSYALMSDGTVRGWGNARGLALGHADIDIAASPIAIAGIERATAIAASGERRAKACVIRSDASVICWGERDGFPIALDDSVASMPPTEIPTLAGAQQISLGTARSCALMNDGSVRCWGKFEGATDDEYIEPTVVEGLSDVVAVTTGSTQACALAKNGDVRCWGSLRINGSFSRPTLVDQMLAEDVPPAIELALDGFESCTRNRDDTLRCWDQSQLRTLDLDRKPIALARNGIARHLCVVVEGGGVRCWGDAHDGRLGVDASLVADARQLVSVAGLPTMSAAVTAPTHTCALADDGEVWCWGGNSFAQLGDGTIVDRSLPKQVVHLLDRELAPPPALVDVTPAQRFDALPEGCHTGALTMSIPLLPRPRFDIRFADALISDDTIWVHLRDHGFDEAKTIRHAPPRGAGLVLELVFSRSKVGERRIRDPEPWQEGETQAISRKLPLELGTYSTSAAWFAMGSPGEHREVDVSLTAADGPILLDPTLLRDGDLQQVELTRIGPDWVCGTITMASALGQLQGDFAARVPK